MDMDAEDFNSPDDLHRALDDRQRRAKVIPFPVEHYDGLQDAIALVENDANTATTVAQVYPIFVWLQRIEVDIARVTATVRARLNDLIQGAK